MAGYRSCLNAGRGGTGASWRQVFEQQWRDVIGVLKVQENLLDRKYLQKWAAELGITDLLEKAWREVDR